MARPKVYVTNGLGIGCHEEVAHAYDRAGADAEIIHIKQLLSGEKRIFDAQVINLAGGFLHGDILGAGMCAANELEHAAVLSGDEEKKIKDLLIEFADKGVIYGQCNGFQLLVKTGLLPGVDNDYSRQTVTLTHNDCGNYRVDYVLHSVDQDYVDQDNLCHFAFRGLEDSPFYLWCRHGEGKLMFHSGTGIAEKDKAEDIRWKVNRHYTLLRYVDKNSGRPTEEFPHNPNGSVDGIAGLVNFNGHIFGHMAHTEVGVYLSRDPRWFFIKDCLRRDGIKSSDIDEEMQQGVCLRIFQNIVDHFD